MHDPSKAEKEARVLLLGSTGGGISRDGKNDVLIADRGDAGTYRKQEANSGLEEEH